MCQSGPRWHVHSGGSHEGPRRALLVGLFALLGALFAMGAGCKGEPPATTPGGLALDGSRRPLASHPDAGGLAESGVGPAPSPLLALIPLPKSASTCPGTLSLEGVEIVVDDDPEARAVGLRLAEWLGIGASLVRAIPAGAPGPRRAIVLRLERAASPPRDPAAAPPEDTNDEAYTLDVASDGAVLRAARPAGLFYGAQSLAQLAGSRPILGAAPLHPRALPCLHIADSPALRFRAMHLDVARHFFTKEVVKRYVDLLAFYKYNVFHWHLTDDQGFRLSIRSHPELTKVSGASYTQDEVREVVAFAKERFVTVIPEIEMPGHARAILASHPELSCTGKRQEVPTTWGVFEDVLCAGNEGTFALLGDILRETTELFPSRLVHIGGDEVPKARWTACPKCRAKMAKEKLTAEELQGAFTKRAAAMLGARGRRAVVWDDALEGGAVKDAVVVAWQSTARGGAAVRKGHDTIMAPSDVTYFNFWQSPARTEHGHPGHEGALPWPNVLAFDPIPAGLDETEARHVLGGEGALWTEYVKTSEDIDTLLLPRLAALSDALWHRGTEQASFIARFAAQRPILDAAGVRYFVEPPLGLTRRRIFLDAISVELAPPPLHPDGVVRFTLDGSEPTATSPIFSAPIVLRASTSAAARLFLPGGRSSDVVRGTLEHVKLNPPIQPSMMPSMFREGVLYKYFEGDFRQLPDFATLTPKRTGRLSTLSFDPSFRAERFAVLYDAWVTVPRDGVYRFVAHADDGVWLEVDGMRIVEDDGEHAARDAEGEVALEHGPHTIRVGYFQGGGGKELRLACAGPQEPLGSCRLVSP